MLGLSISDIKSLDVEEQKEFLKKFLNFVFIIEREGLEDNDIYKTAKMFKYLISKFSVGKTFSLERPKHDSQITEDEIPQELAIFMNGLIQLMTYALNSYSYNGDSEEVIHFDKLELNKRLGNLKFSI